MPTNPIRMIDLNYAYGPFPFCAQSISSGYGTNTFYPVSLTLDEAMAWYWRVQEWTIDYNINYNIGFPVNIAGTFTISNGTVNDVDPPRYCRDRGCYAKTQLGGGPFFDLFTTDYSPFYQCAAVGSAYYPSLYFLVQGSGGIVSFFSCDSGGTSYASAVTLTVDGHNVPLRQVWQFGGPPVPIDLVSESGYITITRSDWPL